MHLVDIGANLTHRSFGRDRDAVLDRARRNGVETMIVTGSSGAGSLEALTLARRWPGLLFSTAGVHPHNAKEVTPQTLVVLRECAQAPEVRAIGETGLDFFRNLSPPEIQERRFEEQLELAAELRLPAFLHQREAHERFVAILRRHRDRLVGAVVHCFTGTREELHDCLELDLHVGITGWICDERRGEHLKEIVADIPADRLMIETDAPYLLPRDLPPSFDPQPHGQRNEPALLPHILRTTAEVTGKPPEELAAETTATARAFFVLPGCTD